MKEENPQHMARRVSPISWATTTQRIKVLSQQVTTVRFLLLGYFNWCKRFRYNLGWIARRSIASDAQLMLSENQSFLETFISSYLIGIEVDVQIFYKMDIQSFWYHNCFSFASLSLSLSQPCYFLNTELHIIGDSFGYLDMHASFLNLMHNLSQFVLLSRFKMNFEFHAMSIFISLKISLCIWISENCKCEYS